MNRRNESSSKYASIFFLVIFINIFLFFALSSLLGGSDSTDLIAIGVIISLLLSFIIVQGFYVIDLIKKK